MRTRDKNSTEMVWCIARTYFSVGLLCFGWSSFALGDDTGPEQTATEATPSSNLEASGSPAAESSEPLTPSEAGNSEQMGTEATPSNGLEASETPPSESPEQAVVAPPPPPPAPPPPPVSPDVLAGQVRDLLTQGDYQAAWQSLEPAVTQSEKMGDAAIQADLLLAAGRTRVELGDPFVALEFLEKAEALYKGQKNKSGVAEVLGVKGMVYTELVRVDEAVDHYTRAIRGLGKEPARKGFFVVELGRLYLRARETEIARGLFDKALGIARKANLPLDEARALLHQGIASVDLHNAHQGVEEMLKAVELYKTEGQPRLEAQAREALIFPYLAIGEYDNAIKQAEQVVALCPEPWSINPPDLEATDTLWKTYFWKGDYKKILDLQEDMMEKAQAHHAQLLEANVMERRADLLSTLGRFGESLEYYKMADLLYQDAGKPRDRIRLLQSHLATLRDMGAVETLKTMAYQVRDMAGEAQRPIDQADLLSLAGRALVDASESDPGIEALTQAMGHYSGLENRTKEGITLTELARAYDRKGEYATAMQQLKKAQSVFRKAGDDDWQLKVGLELKERDKNHGRLVRSIGFSFRILAEPGARIWTSVEHAPLGEYQNSLRMLRYVETYEVFQDPPSIDRPQAFRFDPSAMPLRSVEAYAGEVLQYDQQRLAARSVGALGDSISMADELMSKTYLYENFMLTSFGDSGTNAIMTAIEAAGKYKYRRLQALAMGFLIEIYLDKGSENGLSFLRERLALEREMGDVRGALKTMQALIDHYLDNAQERRAFSLAEEAIELAKANGNRRAEGFFLMSKGLAQLAVESAGNAVESAQQALAIAEEIHCPLLKLTSQSVLVAGNEKLQNSSESQRVKEEAAALIMDPKTMPAHVPTLIQVGDAYQRMGMTDQARAFYRHASRRVNKKQDPEEYRLIRTRLEGPTTTQTNNVSATAPDRQTSRPGRSMS